MYKEVLNSSHTYQTFNPLFKTALFEFIGLAKQNALMGDKDGLDWA